MPDRPCPFTAVPAPFLCSALGLLPLHWHRPLFLICQIQREGKGSVAGVVLWILTRFRGIWCVSVLKSLYIGFMLHEPSTCSSLGRTQPAFWKPGRDYRAWAAALLSCISPSLSSEGNFFILIVENKCYFFFILLRGHKTKNTAHHAFVLQGQIQDCIVPYKWKKYIYEIVSAHVKVYLHQVISNNGLCTFMISNLLCVSHTCIFFILLILAFVSSFVPDQPFICHYVWYH